MSNIPAEILGGQPGEHIASDNLVFVAPERWMTDRLCSVFSQLDATRQANRSADARKPDDR